MPFNRNKLNFRQTSLICDSPKTESRRNSLRKQSSEDISIQRNNFLNNEIKITVNTKCKIKSEFPKPRIAWGETESEETHEPVMGIKCQENKKPARQLTKQTSIQQDSILSCKEDLIDKLRLLLKDDKDIPEKQNISIFLGRTRSDSEENVPQMNKNKSKPIKLEEKISEEGPTVKFNSDCNSANTLFQFRQPTSRNVEEKRYYPSTSQDYHREPPNILVTPVAGTSFDDEPKHIITDNSQPINNIIIRQTTAASKRDLFKRRTNSAFHSTVKEVNNTQKAPLQRSSSAPIRPDHAKSKFLATKRKLKNTRKKDSKSAKKGSCENKVGDDQDCLGIDTSTPRNGTEIITMVSLVSPAGSDAEEIPDLNKDDNESKSRNNSPRKPLPISKGQTDVPRISSLRKVAKQVSFQQSTIHAIRSFSAGFPGRKHSMVTSLMLGGVGNLKRANTTQKIQEKRVTTAMMSDDDERVPKRRLMRSRSAQLDSVSPEDKDETDRSITPLPDDQQPDITVNIEMKALEDMEESGRDNEKLKNTQDKKQEEPTVTDEKVGKEELKDNRAEDGQQFSTLKEKECWNLYQKMNNKGVKVNYDTLLRGMLTPTEYRTRRQSLAAAASLKNEESPQNDMFAL